MYEYCNSPLNNLCTACSEDQFTCSDGSSVPLNFECDGVQDCSGGEDEQNDCPEGGDIDGNGDVNNWGGGNDHSTTVAYNYGGGNSNENNGVDDDQTPNDGNS